MTNDFHTKTPILASIVLLMAGLVGNVYAEHTNTAPPPGYNQAPPAGGGYGGYPPPPNYGYNRGNNYAPYGGSGFNGPWNNRGYNTPWNNRGFNGPWGGGPSFNGPWNRGNSNFMPWNNRGGWGNGRNPFGNRGFGSWMNPNKRNMADNWDDMLNAPSRMGEMPGGWTAPSVSMPNPIDVGDEFSDAARDLPDQMDNFNWNNR